MKKICLAVLLLSQMALAETAGSQSATGTTIPAKTDSGPKITTKDAKKSCKDEGKKGSDLIQCMKDKKEGK